MTNEQLKALNEAIAAFDGIITNMQTVANLSVLDDSICEIVDIVTGICADQKKALAAAARNEADMVKPVTVVLKAKVFLTLDELLAARSPEDRDISYFPA